jgi:hypothetical protein
MPNILSCAIRAMVCLAPRHRDDRLIFGLALVVDGGAQSGRRASNGQQSARHRLHRAARAG